MGMLDIGRRRRKAEHVSDQLAIGKGTADQPALRLDDHHQVGGIRRIALSPDARLQRLGLKEFRHAGEIAELHLRHARKLSRDTVTVSRKSLSSLTPMPGPAGTGIRPSVASSFSSTMSRWK